jgi:putative sigma-54 modulation protein
MGIRENTDKDKIEVIIMGNKQVQNGYNLEILGRHVMVTDPMKDYAIDKLSKIDRFNARVIDIHVTMDIIKLTHSVAIEMKVDHIRIRVQADSDDMYKSIDLAMDKLQSKLRKYKTKIRDHQAKALHVIDLEVNVLSPRKNDRIGDLNDEIDEANLQKIEKQYALHEIKSTETYPLKTLTYDEAAMKMDLSDDNFMLFRSEEDRKLKVIYRMKEEDNYGIIEPVL